ncbi:MAG: hypothetical protein IKD27_10700 [Oscillospiraceae bacterium]|nr:hypothetical protein [Oscillospiraceae bacterium]
MNTTVTHQIHPTNTYRRDALVMLALIVFFSLWEFDGIVSAIVIAFAALYIPLSLRHDRVDYDDTGITLYTIWGKPCFHPWSDLKIDASEELLVSKQLSMGHVLRIRTPKVTYRFSYRHYTGISEFLEFAARMT